MYVYLHLHIYISILLLFRWIVKYSDNVLFGELNLKKVIIVIAKLPRQFKQLGEILCVHVIDNEVIRCFQRRRY